MNLGTLEVANTRTMVGNTRVLEKDTKTVSVERALPLPKWPWEALNRFRAQQAREKLAAGAGYTDTGYVLVDELGLALNTRHLREHAYRLMEELGLRRVRPISPWLSDLPVWEKFGRRSCGRNPEEPVSKPA
ncbi:hypothetical protein [Streptomyces albofaciens]|uniref:hypothetical protein n=1 Tax=Streptomyces albofaciens TaxID=66866 RepID=UPI001AD621AF|nr:hypothetical protein [Streptomyces albofaciens]